MKTATPTIEELEARTAFWRHYEALKDAGKHEEAMAFYKQNRPLPAWAAKVMKKLIGADHIRNGGWDLSEVEAKLGKEWLDR